MMYLKVLVSKALNGIRNITKVYLFGSYAKLIHANGHDVDLAIVLKKKNKNTINNQYSIYCISPWIEAQLKRGRTKQQIKGFLIRKGYSPKAVARVCIFLIIQILF